VNVNLRPYYAEGSKTVGYEIAEQLGWRLPDNIVCPMAGGSLIVKIKKAFDELVRLGLVEEKKVPFLRCSGNRVLAHLDCGQVRQYGDLSAKTLNHCPVARNRETPRMGTTRSKQSLARADGRRMFPTAKSWSPSSCLPRPKVFSLKPPAV
jgi:hypothetical protein